MFVAFDADGDDGFAIVALVPIANGTSIKFFDTNGTEITWTATANVAPGTVIIFESVQNASASVNIGSVNRMSGFTINAENWSIVAQDGATNTCLAAIKNESDLNPLSVGCEGVLSANYIVDIDLDEDVMIYTGPTVCNTTLADCQAMIANPANWTTEDGAGDQSIDGMGVDFPASVVAAFSGSALPIELTYFHAKLTGKTVMLNWRTETEENNAYMAVERSSEGSNFVEIGRVKGAGTTVEPKEYSFLDHNPKAGINYYRLRQVDMDGSTHYHKVVAVNYTGKDTHVTLFPTVAADFITLQMNKTVATEGRLQVLNIYGKIVAEQVLAAGTGQVEIDVTKLAVGNYFVRLVVEGERMTERFIKQ